MVGVLIYVRGHYRDLATWRQDSIALLEDRPNFAEEAWVAANVPEIGGAGTIVGLIPIRRARDYQADRPVVDEMEVPTVGLPHIGQGAGYFLRNDPCVVGILLDGDRTAIQRNGGLGRSANASEGIEHRLSHEREQLDEAMRDLGWKDGWMFRVAHVGNVPDRLRELPPFFLRELARLLVNR